MGDHCVALCLSTSHVGLDLHLGGVCGGTYIYRVVNNLLVTFKMMLNNLVSYMKLTKSRWFFKITRTGLKVPHAGTWIVLVNLFEKHEGVYAQ